MSGTPRVDAYIGNLIDGVSIFDYREFTEFARQLERELSAKTDEIAGGYKEKYLLLAAQHTREIEMILSVIEEIGRKADGGLCSMTFGGARAFLTDIKEKCKEISELG